MEQPTGHRREPSIEVIGVGEVEVISDQVEVQLGVEATRPGQEQAVLAVGQQTDRLRELLDHHRVPAADRQTIWTFVRPVHDAQGRETGQHVAGNWLLVRLSDVAVASRLLGEATRTVGPGLRIAHTRWSLSKQEDHEAEARRLAVADAAERAAQLAAAAGVRRGRLLAIVESPDHVEPMMYRSAAGVAEHAGATVPLEPGRQTVTVRVKLAYGIEDAVAPEEPAAGASPDEEPVPGEPAREAPGPPADDRGQPPGDAPP
jgi:uncharacterized protein YggE